MKIPIKKQKRKERVVEERRIYDNFKANNMFVR